MRRFIWLISLVFVASLLFVCCDNPYKGLNTGNGVFYYGEDNLQGGFYGFIKGGRYYFEKHEDYVVVNILDYSIDGNDVYLLCREIHGNDTCNVIRKNGKMTSKFKWRNDGILLVINGKVRVYSKYFSYYNLYTYKPQYWEDGQLYDVELEAPTFEALTVFAQPSKFLVKNGDVYCLGFLATVNGNTACVWKNNRLMCYYDPTKNSLRSTVGFAVDKNDDIIMFKDIENYYLEQNNRTYSLMAASFKNGDLFELYYDTAKINLKDYRCWCGGATQVNDDIYFAVLQYPNSGVRENEVILYKNFKEVCRLESYQFLRMCVKNDVIYTAQRFVSAQDGYYSISFYENDKLLNLISVPGNSDIMIRGMFVIP